MVLFGTDESKIEFLDMDDRIAHMDDESGEEDPLEAFADVDYEKFEGENATADPKSSWREGSK